MDALVSLDINWGFIFLTQTAAGILGNSSLFLHFFSLLSVKVVRPTDLILSQLVLANILVLISKGIPQTLGTLGLESFLDEVMCKFIFYLYRVARGVTLSTTSLLSGFQASKLYPKTSGWLELQIRFSKSIGICCFLCWILHLLLYIDLTMSVTGPVDSRNTSGPKMYRYCSSPIPSRPIFLLRAAIYSLSDGICLGLMAWASGSMVLVLHRHKHRVQHIHCHTLSPRPSHEDRATGTILILASTFISFYALSSFLSLRILHEVNPSQWLRNSAVLMSLGFSTLSPFVFYSRTSHGPRFSFVCYRRKTNALTMVSGV